MVHGAGMWSRHLFLSLATCLSTPAWADWEWTRWGMTVREAHQSAPGASRKLEEPFPGGKYVNHLSVPAAISDLRFQALLAFDKNGRLGFVELRPAGGDRDCAGVAAAMDAAFGEPLSERREPTERMLWSDLERENLVEFTRADDRTCRVRYMPLPRRNPYLPG